MASSVFSLRICSLLLASCVPARAGKQSLGHSYATCFRIRDRALAKFPGGGIGSSATRPGRFRQCRCTGSRIGRQSRGPSGFGISGRNNPGCGEEAAGGRGHEEAGCRRCEWKQKAPPPGRPGARWYSEKDCGARGRRQRTCSADCARHDSRGSGPRATEHGTVAGLDRRPVDGSGVTHIGCAAAGDGGTDSQLYGRRAGGFERWRCTEGEYAGDESAFAGGRSGQALRVGSSLTQRKALEGA